MIRLAAMNESGIAFERAPGLRCIGAGGSQDFALRIASNEMKPLIKSLDGMIKSFGVNVDENDNTGAYVVTEETGKKYGAICLFFGGVMEMLHAQLGDFYALPSSIHEWIIVRRERELLDDLRRTVREVNCLIDPNDKLSDDVYEYMAGVFRIAK